MVRLAIGNSTRVDLPLRYDSTWFERVRSILKVDKSVFIPSLLREKPEARSQKHEAAEAFALRIIHIAGKLNCALNGLPFCEGGLEFSEWAISNVGEMLREIMNGCLDVLRSPPSWNIVPNAIHMCCA